MIPVEADVGQAEDDISRLTDQLDNLGGSATGAASGVSSLGGSADGAAAGLGGLGAQAGGAIDKVTALQVGAVAGGAGLAYLFTQGLEATSQLQRFTLITGQSAEAVRSIDVGGLNGDLGELALQLGSDDEAALNASASLFQFGINSGRTRDEVTTTTTEIAALALRARALNPALGDVAQIQDGLSRALARGGRFAAGYGLSLTSAEINARALADTGKKTSDELTQFDKVAAGAAIAAERLGSTLGNDVARGSENAQIRFDRFKQALSEAVETLGKPLVSPVLDLLEDGQPILETTAGILGDLAEGVLPAVAAGFSLIGPPLQLIAFLLDAIPDPVIAGVAAFFALNAILPFAAAGLDAVAIGAYNAAGGLGALNIAAVANPVTLLAAGLAVAVGAFLAFKGANDSANDSVERSAEVTKRLRQALSADLGPAVLVVGEQVAALAGENENLQSALSDTGLTADQFAQFIVSMGEAEGTTAERSGSLTDDILALGSSASTTGGDFQNITSELITLNDELQTASHRAIDLAVTSGQMTQAIAEAAIEQNTAADGTVNYVAALNDARIAAAEYAVATGQAIDGSGRIVEAFGLAGAAAEDFGQKTIDAVAEALTSFEDLNEDGTTSLEEFVTSIGLNAANAANFIDNVTAVAARGFPQLAAALFEAGPQFADAAAGVTTASDDVLGQFERIVTGSIDLKDQTAAQAQALRDTLISALGDPAAADAFLAQLDSIPADAAGTGAEAAANLADPAAAAAAGNLAGSTFALGLSTSGVSGAQTAMQAIGSTIIGSSPNKIASATGQAVGTLFGVGVLTGSLTSTSAAMRSAGSTIAAQAPVGTAGSAGRRVGQNLGAGIAAGIRDTTSAIASAAAQAVNEAEAAARRAADSNSPSRLFAKIGADLSRGMAVGIREEAHLVATESARATSAAADAARGRTVALAATGSVGGGVAVGGSRSLSVTIGAGAFVLNLPEGTTPDDARAIGSELADGFDERLAERHDIIDSQLA